MSCKKERGLPPMSRDFLLVAGVAAAWFAPPATAGCPPGYLSKAGTLHCGSGAATPSAGDRVDPARAGRGVTGQCVRMKELP